MRHLIFMLCLALAIAACGGDPAGTDDGSGAEPSSSPPSALSSEPSTPDDSDETAASGSGPEGDLPFENGEGFFTIDGERFDPEFVVSCIPFDASEFGGRAGHPDDVAINAIKDGTALEVQVAYEEGAGAGGDKVYDAVFVSPIFLRPGEDGQESFEASFLTDPEGVWYSAETDSTIQLSMGNAAGAPLDDAPMIRQDNRITGTVTLPQTWPDGASGSVAVSYDLSFASEQFDCSTR